MATWNDIFLERLFNHSKFEDGQFILPEGYGNSDNYSRVIEIFRILQSVDFDIVLEVDVSAKSLWRAIKKDTLIKSTDSTPEEAVKRLIAYMEGR